MPRNPTALGAAVAALVVQFGQEEMDPDCDGIIYTYTLGKLYVHQSPREMYLSGFGRDQIWTEEFPVQLVYHAILDFFGGVRLFRKRTRAVWGFVTIVAEVPSLSKRPGDVLAAACSIWKSIRR